MKIRVLGGGWYGCHIALSCIEDGHSVELWEASDHLFAGASGANPARCHLGFHYPRSRLTRAMCQSHSEEFLRKYGHLTNSVPINIYAIAEDSLLDFGTYCQVLKGEVDFVPIYDPSEFGLHNVEGAILTGERHVIIDRARRYFEDHLGDSIRYQRLPEKMQDENFDLTIDCTFSAFSDYDVDRYEPCVVGILEGRSDIAVTIMDGPFPSLYPWNESYGLSSITSASLTPLSKTCKTYADAKAIFENMTKKELFERVSEMMFQMNIYYHQVLTSYNINRVLTSIRAMPKSRADARLVDVKEENGVIRIRAGKIDAILAAEKAVKEIITC